MPALIALAKSKPGGRIGTLEAITSSLGNRATDCKVCYVGLFIHLVIK